MSDGNIEIEIKKEEECINRYIFQQKNNYPNLSKVSSLRDSQCSNNNYRSLVLGSLRILLIHRKE